MTLIRLFSCPLLLVTVFAAVGCGSDEAGAPEAEPEAMATIPDKDGGEGFSMSFKGRDGKAAEITGGGEDGGFSMNIQGEDGVQMKVGHDAAMPAEFPKDVPTYKGMTLNLSQASGEGFVIQGTVTDDLDTVAAFFKAQAVTDGWTEESSFSTTGDGALIMLNYTKNERTLNVSISRQDNETMIQIATNE